MTTVASRTRPQHRTAPTLTQASIDRPIDLNWSNIKYLFINIQHNKCAFCERKLAAREDGGAIEHDVEHFRPKNAIKAWKPPSDLERLLMLRQSARDPGQVAAVPHIPGDAGFVMR